MKFKLNLGTINQVSTSFINGKNENVITPVIQNLSIEYELSTEDMVTQMKNIRELLSMIKEGYLFIKEEASNEESANFLLDLISLFKKGYTIEEEKEIIQKEVKRLMTEKGLLPEEKQEKETNTFTDILYRIISK